MHCLFGRPIVEEGREPHVPYLGGIEHQRVDRQRRKPFAPFELLAGDRCTCRMAELEGVADGIRAEDDRVGVQDQDVVDPPLTRHHRLAAGEPGNRLVQSGTVVMLAPIANQVQELGTMQRLERFYRPIT